MGGPTQKTVNPPRSISAENRRFLSTLKNRGERARTGSGVEKGLKKKGVLWREGRTF